MKLYYKFRMFWYNVRARCQRFKRGWAYRDVWNMNDWFKNTIRPMLIYLADNHVGVPAEFENNPGGWKEVLNKMATCLQFMDEDSVLVSLGIHDYKGMTAADYKNVHKLMIEYKNRFFELFSEYYFDLWD